MAATVTEAERILNDEKLAEEQLLAELENEDIPQHIQEARLNELKKKTKHFQEMKDKQHGNYNEIIEQKGFLDLTTSEEKCVVHFFHPDFRRCDIMHKHLEKLSREHFETKFAKMNVDKANFFVNKLNIRVLPAVFCFKNGIICDRIIGFESLGNSDDFPTSVLEKRLGKCGVIEFEEEEEDTSRKTIFGRQKTNKDDDSSDED